MKSAKVERPGKTTKDQERTGQDRTGQHSTGLARKDKITT